MQHTYSILCFLKKEKKQKGNETSIQLRITVNGQRAEISIKRKIDPLRWDVKANRVKGNKEDAREINSLIDSMTLRLNKIHRDLIDQNEIITASGIKNIFNGDSVKRKTLLEVFQGHNKMMESRVGVDFARSTYTRYQTTYDHIVKFMSFQYHIADIYLHQVKFSFITDLENFLKVVRRCNHNSTLKYIRYFRKIINTAVKNDWLDKDPFKAYSVKLKDTKRSFLTLEELKTLELKQLDIQRLEQVRDVFVFCCYTGLSYVDVEKLTANNIVTGFDGERWITIDRTKTGSPSQIPLLPKAKEIMHKYKDCPEANYSGKLLPVISNQRINGYLKELATLTGITKRLTFHVARHTFATTVTLSNGVPIESVSSMLGHKNFRTTQIYARVVQEKISADMISLRNKFLSRKSVGKSKKNVKPN